MTKKEHLSVHFELLMQQLKLNNYSLRYHFKYEANSWQHKVGGAVHTSKPFYYHIDKEKMIADQPKLAAGEYDFSKNPRDFMNEKFDFNNRYAHIDVGKSQRPWWLRRADHISIQ